MFKPAVRFGPAAWGSKLQKPQSEIGGPSRMTVGLRAEFRFAHCAPISFGPTRDSPSHLLPSAVFLHRHHRPAAQREKNPHPPHTRLRTRLSKWRPQRVNFEWERGSSLAGRSNTNWGPLPDDGLRSGPTFAIAPCAPISFGPLAVHPCVFSRPPFSFTVTTGLPPSGKNPAPATHSAPHSTLEVAGPTGNF